MSQNLSNLLIYNFNTSNYAHVQAYLSNFVNYEGDVCVKFLELTSPRYTFDRHFDLKFNKVVTKIHRFYIPHILHNLFLILYCLVHRAKYKKIDIIFKKVSIPSSFSKFLTNVLKVNIAIEIEGNLEAEFDYLKNHYSKFSGPNLETSLALEEYNYFLNTADKIIVTSSNYAEYLSKKLGNKKVIYRPTGYSVSDFRYDKSIREKYRKAIGLTYNLVGVYAGNVRYSWQNVTDAILLFNDLFEICRDYRLIIATPKSDVYIAEQFISLYDRNSICFIRSFSHSEMVGAYNAADVGILLRKNHIMNVHSCPGKMGEYLGCGLPVVTTRHVGTYSDWLAEKTFAYFIEDDILERHEFKRAVNDVDKFIRNNQRPNKRRAVSLLASAQFSSDSSRGQGWIDKVLT